MGFRIVKVPAELLLAMMTADGSVRFKADGSLPDDAQIVDVSDAEMCFFNRLTLKIASATWEDPAENEPIPQIDINFTRLPAGLDAGLKTTAN